MKNVINKGIENGEALRLRCIIVYLFILLSIKKGVLMIRPFGFTSLALLLSLLPTAITVAKDCCIQQKDIPLVIKNSGEYRLEEDIIYDGAGAAITIKADNVKLNLETFSLSLSNVNATGILVKNVSEFVIESDAIKNISSKTQNGNAIHIVNSRKGLLANLLTVNNFNGLFIENSSDILVQDSEFFTSNNAGALVSGSTNITFVTCVFANCGNGLKFSGANQDCALVNSAFPSATFSNLLVQQMNGMFVENCSFTNVGGAPTKLNLVQFGDADPAQLCNDVIFKNCTLVNRPAHTPTLGNTAPEGLGIYQGSGFLVEDCVVDIDNTNQDPAADLSCYHVSNPGLGVSGTTASNVVFRNCIAQGPATDGFYPDVSSSGVVIENCFATDAQKDGIFVAGTSACTVQNNTVVNNGTNGIFVGETSVANAVNNNVVSGNGFNPIVSSLPPFGNGISIASDSSLNTVQRNEVFNNAVNGVDDQGTGNRIFYNTAYANVNKNYNAATDVIVVSAPGAPSKAAENISA